MRRRGGVVRSVAVTLLFTQSAFAQQPGQPLLAEVARQAEAARPTAKKATRSYTNANLKRSPPPEPAAPASSAGYVSAMLGRLVTPDEMVQRSQEVVAEKWGGSQPEEHWRGRADSIRFQAGALQARLTDLTLPNTVRDSNPAAKRESDAETTRVRQGLAGLMKQWARLEESARVADVPDAWLGPRPRFE